jgi:hypothetical protein
VAANLLRSDRTHIHISGGVLSGDELYAQWSHRGAASSTDSPGGPPGLDPGPFLRFWPRWTGRPHRGLGGTLAADAASDEAAATEAYVAQGQRQLVAGVYRRRRHGLRERGLEPAAEYEPMMLRHVPEESTYTEENVLARLEFLPLTNLHQTLVYVREPLGDDNFELPSRAGGSSAMTMPSTSPR